MAHKKMIKMAGLWLSCIMAIVVVSQVNLASGGSGEQQLALNYLLFSSQHHNAQISKFNELLKDANHSHASDTVNLSLANTIWKEMHRNALLFARQRTQEARPTINKLLQEAGISSVCHRSLMDILDHLSSLETWAVEMYNSYGNFPATGLFEGTATSLGSYHQCVDVKPNQFIGHPQYCTFNFQPIVPKRPRYHNILAPIEGLANFTGKDDVFHQLARKAHYFYYIKLRLATCMPDKCDQSDLELLGKQVAVNSYLQYSGVSCLVKQEGFNPDAVQIFAIALLSSLASVSVLGTLVHLFNLRSYFVKKDESTDLNKNLFNKNQTVIGAQTLLVANDQQKPHILPQSMALEASSSSVNSKSKNLSGHILHIIEVLLHFSIIRNGRKLFDTSTSRRNKNSTGSPVPSNDNPMEELKIDSTQSDFTSCNQSSRSASVAGSQGESNDISCVHGLRFWTISWIIFGHTMQYTEWAGFGRAYQVETNIVSFFLHPLFNATFSVDTFFLISGLLTTYVTWSITRGQYKRFNKFAFLISRYLRLTPQVLLVVLLFIIFPLFGDGPHWSGLIKKESDNCKSNWWVNALYLQAFIKQDKICNLVTWWLSIEMFYHLVSIFVIIALLKSTRKGIIMSITIGGGLTAMSCYLHFVNHYPPNMLPTLLQRYEIWTSIVLKYFWTPYPHAPSYFTGLLLGYLLHQRQIIELSKTQVKYGWITFAVCYITILFGTYRWNNNAPYSRFMSTIYYNLSQILWSLATGWCILACALGHGGWLNRFLSSPLFVPLGRATYMTYLSHMIIVLSFPAKMNLLIEPSYTVFLYIFISNLFLSYALGIFLTLIYESPILHLQKALVTGMALKFSDDSKKSNCEGPARNESTRVSLYTSRPVADGASH